MRVDLNSDMGEGFGRWELGDDAAMLDIVTSANVACGWHAGDPNIMVRTAEIAKAKGVAVGAHPGWGDLWGFGRRVIRGDSIDAIARMTAYQIGAMQACAAMAGHKVSYVKVHGALSNVANEDADVAEALARGVKGVDPGLLYLTRPGLAADAGRRHGLHVVNEVFADRTYDDDGTLTSRKTPGSLIHDPAVASERVLRMVQEGAVVSVSGKRLPVEVHSICVHGDNPAAVALARAVRTRLEGAGVTLAPFAPV
jgi:5-oxoprolinase (ATP-hydrolysing) subunit A